MPPSVSISRPVYPPYLRQRLQLVAWVMPTVAFATIGLNLLGRWAGITPVGGHAVVVLAMVLATLGGALFARRWIRRRIAREVLESRGTLCPRCGYALMAPAPSPTCPECGLRVTPEEAQQTWKAAGFSWPESNSLRAAAGASGSATNGGRTPDS